MNSIKAKIALITDISIYNNINLKTFLDEKVQTNQIKEVSVS